MLNIIPKYPHSSSQPHVFSACQPNCLVEVCGGQCSSMLHITLKVLCSVEVKFVPITLCGSKKIGKKM